MQPKFTQQSLGYFCTKIIALALIFSASTQFSFAQQKQQRVAKVPNAAQKQLAEQKKLFLQNAAAVSRNATGANAVASVGRAPVQPWAIYNDMPQTSAGNPASRAFCYQDPAAGQMQLNKHSVLNTTLTPVGPLLTGIVFPGANAWVTTTNKLYEVDQGAPFGLYIVDTTTGVRTLVANCTGVPQANLTGMTWDFSTNTMYGVSTTLGVSQIFTMNITTGVCTPIGAATAICAGAIMLNAAPGGSLFSVDIVADNLYKWNKTTGVPVLVGPLGLDANFGQDGHFDLSDGQYYWAGVGNGAFSPSLRIIDTTTGSSTLVANYAIQTGALGIYSIPQIPCAGTPAPGNTVSSANPVCPGVNFTLSMANILGSGTTYQWQSGPAVGGPFTDIVGATSSSYTTNIATATAYRCNARCTASGITTASNPLLVTISAPSACYCFPTYSNGCAGFGDNISNVTLLTLNNSSVCTGQYTYYNAVAAPSVIAGGTYTLSVTVGTDPAQFVGAWIDYNQDGTFSTSEFLAIPVNPGSNGTANISFTVPAGATVGTTRLRIRGGDDNAMTSAQACGASNSTFGEAEDYNLTIAACVQGVFTSNPANSTVQCSGNTSFSFSATGSALVYGWEYRTSAAGPWLTVTNGGVYSGATTTTLTLLNVPGTMSGYQYRALISGPCTAVDFSSVATLTVTPLVATVTPTSATICAGTIVNLVLTNPTSTPIYGLPSGLPVDVPDGTGVAALSTIAVSNVPVGAVVTNISVKFTMTHTFVGDMEINLKAPNNAIINLVGGLDGGAHTNATANFTNTIVSSTSVTPMSGAPAPRTGTFKADALPGYGPIGYVQTTPLWSGLTSTLNGNWTLAMSDWGAIDFGKLLDWSITITFVAPPAQGVWTASPAAPNTMFTDAAATVPYTGTPANNIYVKPAVSTNYSVVYTTTTPCTSGPTVIPITVVNPVSAPVNPTNKIVCVGGTTSFTASATGGPLTYQWQVSTDGGVSYNDIPGATSSTLTLTGVTQVMNNNLYRVKITAAPCGGTTTTLPGKLTVNPLPVVTISTPTVQLTPGVTTVITAVSSPAAASYSWTLNGNTIAGATTNTVTATIDALGSYRATVTDVNTCTNSSNILVIGAKASDRLWIYPNPNVGQFQVRLFYSGALADRRVVHIYNMDGQQVAQKEFDLFLTTPPYMRMDFDLSKLAAGTYVVKCVNLHTQKITSGLVVLQ